jgi:hypothetical protein
VDERHPRVLSNIMRLKVRQEQPSHAQIFSPSALPQGGNEFGQRTFSGSVCEHPRSDLTEVWQRRSDVKSKATIRHGDICPGFVREVTNTNDVGFFEKPQGSSL